jgi:hypothetical protein
MSKNKNMYQLSAKQWNPFKGCKYDCTYCKSSFKRQAKRQKHRCSDCYSYEPHFHPERLTESLPRTRFMQFIFTCASGDVSFCSTENMTKIVDRIKAEPDKTFLVQSKNPKTFNRVEFPKKVIMGTTIETNRDELYGNTAKAPKPSERYQDFLSIKHPTKMVTIEPVIDFDLDLMVQWITDINPVMVWLGYDSGQNNLPEPALDKVKDLHWRLSQAGYVVMLKKIRDAR